MLCIGPRVIAAVAYRCHCWARAGRRRRLGRVSPRRGAHMGLFTQRAFLACTHTTHTGSSAAERQCAEEDMRRRSGQEELRGVEVP